MDLNWRLCFPALLRGVKNLDSTSLRLKSGSDVPCHCTPAVVSCACSVCCCGHLLDYPAGYIFIENILFISCLQRFALRLNSGALTMADKVSSILLTAPLPIFSLFGRLIALNWKGLLHCGMKEDLMQCHCLLHFFFFFRHCWCPAWKKHLYVPSMIVSSNKHQQANFSVLPYRWTHSWENVFFFLSFVGAMASPFFLGLTGLVVPVLPRLSRYCLLPISLLGL